MARLHRHAHHARFGLSGALGLLALTVVLVLRIGPVVLVLSPTHGLHSGDVIGLLAAAVAMWVLRLGSPTLETRPAA